MPTPPSNLPPPEILPPLNRRGTRMLRGKSSVFDDQNLDLIAHVLDDWLRIPGTSIRFGLDGIVGLIPGIGDILGGLASLIILIAAWARGLPYITLFRMAFNIGLSVLVGAIPFLGDLFDIAWKANRRNYKLLTRHLTQPRKHTWRDWAFLALLGAILAAVFATPVILLILILRWLSSPATSVTP
jgi:Domain of unknown function (DUF4112)